MHIWETRETALAPAYLWTTGFSPEQAVRCPLGFLQLALTPEEGIFAKEILIRKRDASDTLALVSVITEEGEPARW